MSKKIAQVVETVANTLMDAQARAMDLILPPLVDRMAAAGFVNEAGEKFSVDDAAKMLNLTIAPPPDGARRRLSEDKDRNALTTWSTLDESGRWHVYIHPDSIQRADKGDAGEVARIAGGLLHEVASLSNPSTPQTRKNGTTYTPRYTVAWKNTASLLGLDVTAKKTKTKLADNNDTMRLVEAVGRACHVAAPAIGGKNGTERIRFSLRLMGVKDGRETGLLTIPSKSGDAKMLNLSIGEDAAMALSTLNGISYQLRLCIAAPYEKDEKGSPVWHDFATETLDDMKAKMDEIEKNTPVSEAPSKPTLVKVKTDETVKEQAA